MQYKQANAARALVAAGAVLTPQVEQQLSRQGKTELREELQKLAAQRLEEILTFLERAPERIPDDIANLLLQIALPSAPSVQQLREIRHRQSNRSKRSNN